MWGRIAPLAPLALLAFEVSGCGGAPALGIVVDARHADQGVLEVSIDLRGAARDSTRFRGYASSALLALSQVSATGPGGRALAVRVGVDSTSVDAKAQAVPSVTVTGPLPTRFTLRYLVRPGARGGNAHLGFTGTGFGYAGPRFAFVTGRNLFLLPSPDVSVRDVRVRFQLPFGWRVEAPWRRDGDAWRSDLEGRFAAEHLVGASIGLGRFRERTVSIGGKRLVMAFEDGIPADDEARTAGAMERAARAIDDVFRLPPAYRVVIVPETPEGDVLEDEGWATGQGGTLAPPTVSRLERFARRLIETRTIHAPFRTEVSDPADYWLMDAITQVYAWRTLARIGWADEQAIAEDYARAYVDVLRLPNVEMNLERLYETDLDPTPSR